MRRKTLLLLWLALVSLPSAKAGAVELNWRGYQFPTQPSYREYNSLLLDGIISGLIAYNAAVQASGARPMFCLPPNLALTVEQAEDILIRAAERTVPPDNMPVSIILLHGMQDTFPCKN